MNRVQLPTESRYQFANKKTFCEVIITSNVSYIELWDVKSSKLWSSQLWLQFKQLRIEAWKSQDLVIPVRRSNQMSYEATVSYLNCDHNCEDHSLLEKIFYKWGNKICLCTSLTLKFFRKIFSSQRLLVEKRLPTWWTRVSGFINTMVEMATCETNITCIAHFPFKFADKALLVHN